MGREKPARPRPITKAVPKVASAVKVDADHENDPVIKMLDEQMEEIAVMPLSDAGVAMLLHRLSAFRDGWVHDHPSMMIH